MQVVEVTQMQWEEPCVFHPDIVLAADVLYDPGELRWQSFVTLLPTQFCSNAGVQYYVV